MSTKHFFPSTEGVVILGLESLVSRNSHLSLDAAHKVVFNKLHSRSNVALISGGGSGHEPAWSGYVGNGMLSASVSGEVFSSPATSQVLAAMKHVPSDKGIILAITNYTGDNLHFGLAKEKAHAGGQKVEILRLTDDAALGRSQSTNTGRRGLAGNVLVLKLVGHAASQEESFDTCIRLGEATNSNLVTVGASLDHCRIPGKASDKDIPKNTIFLGMGIHNEPGLREVTPIPSAQDVVKEMLKYALDPSDPDRSFVPFNSNDTTVLLINNFGGISNFELEALTSVTKKMLATEWHLESKRVYVQSFETSLNAPGWSITILNVSGVTRQCRISEEDLLTMLDADTTAPAWPRCGYTHAASVENSPLAEPQSTPRSAAGDTDHLAKVVPLKLLSSLRAGCKATLALEPQITKWDSFLGDGDCGEAVSLICNGILRVLDENLTTELPLLTAIEDVISEVGGTLAALVAIFLTAFTRLLGESPGNVGASLKGALETLFKYTNARKGNKTVVSALEPFCDEFEQGGLHKAAKSAMQGAQGTKAEAGSFGRAAYVAGSAKEDVPDPGAMALATFLEAFANEFESGTG
ncbi:dihydroxyacetone kinase [Piedraia hortae CBS 480.64]|uniref:Dihydroxyacetone kinase n=1 Tax=Piedraia hortae CBS 480.64 TaxID=1314780 RepID=A0A6A7BRI6_9PEZI|nr:dihydroxyacetone kinase [Piedraia hortae CBS 480.64]